MKPKIRYVPTRDEDRVWLAEFVDNDGVAYFEVLILQSIMNNPAVERLKAAQQAGLIADLVLKRCVCWEHYLCADGYDTHEQLTTDDFLSDVFIGMIGTAPYRRDAKYERPDQHNARRKVRFTIHFGPELPEDYYGDYDYSMYPGGYGPSSARS